MGAGGYGNTLYLPLCFAGNLKLLFLSLHKNNRRHSLSIRSQTRSSAGTDLKIHLNCKVFCLLFLEEDSPKGWRCSP